MPRHNDPPADPPADARRHAPATQRNRAPILTVLREILPARGRVLELGVGTGSNLGFYPPEVTDVVGIDPHDAVLDGVTHRTAVLTTGVDNARAQALYDRLGWVLVWEPFAPDGGPEMVVLGKDLWRPRFTASRDRRRAGSR